MIKIRVRLIRFVKESVSFTVLAPVLFLIKAFFIFRNKLF